MELTELKDRIIKAFSGSDEEQEEVLEIVDTDQAVFPYRGNKGNEGQLHIKQDNINQFDQYLLEGDNLEQAIQEASSRN